MNANQQSHHDEQMQARRRDFQDLWQNELQPLALALGLYDPRQRAKCEEIAWQAFRAGQGVAK